MVKLTVTFVSLVGTSPVASKTQLPVFTQSSVMVVLLQRIRYGPSTGREPPSIVKDAVEPTLPVLPLSPLTVEEQLFSVQPSALTAAGTSTIASATTSRK
ncbi:MAG: hypothetical protein WCA51_00835 [Dehalococcoidia bacterium]